MTTTLVVDINGREAMPVRAISYAYGFNIISPDKVAIAAAGEGHYDGSWMLPTYYLSEGNVVERMRSQDWNLHSQRIRSASLMLLNKESCADATKAEWRDRAISLMPAGVFVWVDELLQWRRRILPVKVKNAYPLLAHPERDEPSDDVIKDVIESYPWDVVGDGLSLKIEIAEAEANVVMEGFPSASELPVAPAPEQPVEIEPAPNAGQIPGDLPRVAVGQLAVKAAWELELETKRVATAPEVMKCLQSWADEGREPEYLIRSDRKRRCVIWRTAAGHEKDYGEEACGKALKKWMNSRHEQDRSDASQTLGPLTKAPTLK